MHADFYDHAYFDGPGFDGPGKSNYCGYSIGSSPFVEQADAIEAVLREYSLDGPVLDVGCAKGYLVYVLRQRGIDAYGVDWSPYAIAAADADVWPYLARAAAHRLPFPDRHFALAASFDVLEHMDLPYARHALRETARASRWQLHQVNTGRLDEWRFASDHSHRTRLPIGDWRGLAAALGLSRSIICEPDRSLPFLDEVNR